MSNYRTIIGIAGRARSGKDTIANHMVKSYGFKRYAFADPMKDIVNRMFGWGGDHRDGNLKEAIDPYWGFSPRQAYQRFGTEFGRALNPDLWIMMADVHLPPGRFVISDVRFENEADFCRKHGFLVHVKRPGCISVNAHSSESGVAIFSQDYQITNDYTIEHLISRVNKIMEELNYV